MATKVHPSARESLIKFLNEKLPLIRLSGGSFLVTDTVYELMGIDKLLSNKKSQSAILEQYIGEYPVFQFLNETISSDVRDILEYDSTSNGPLCEKQPFVEVSRYAESLIERFEQLPWSYTFSFPLPEIFAGFIPDGKSEYVLSETMRIIRVNDAFNTEFPLISPVKLRNERINPTSLLALLSDQSPDWSASISFQTQVKGFVGEYGQSSSYRAATNCFRSFLGLMLAIEAVELSTSHILNSAKIAMLIHKRSKAGWQIERRDILDEEISRAYYRLAINDFDGKSVTDETRNKAMRFWMRSCLPAMQDGADCERVRLAAGWLFDSMSNSKSLLAFVQAMTALEILMGEKDDGDEIGLGATIRNRCAFLVAESYDERKYISTELKKIYIVRSNILHKGKDSLNSSEYGMLVLLRWICGRAISKELKLLNAQMINSAASTEPKIAE
jgi:hypothetical protein